MLEKGIPRKDYDILNNANEIIGVVTSGTMSPTLNKSIALGYINSEDSNLNNEKISDLFIYDWNLFC